MVIFNWKFVSPTLTQLLHILRNIQHSSSSTSSNNRKKSLIRERERKIYSCVRHHGRYHPARRSHLVSLYNDSIPADGRQLARDDRSISRGKRSAIWTGHAVVAESSTIIHTEPCFLGAISLTQSTIQRGNPTTCTVASHRRSRSLCRGSNNHDFI